MATTWTIAIDWNSDGDYSDSYEDVTSRVISAEWFLGSKRAYQPTADDSQLALVLDNSDKRFSPENTASALWDSANNQSQVAPFRTVKVQSNDGLTPRTHWVGWIESIQPDVNVNGKRQISINAAGPMQFLKAAETTLILQENRRTDQIIADLLEEVVIPPALGAGWFLGIAGYGELDYSTRVGDNITYSFGDAGWFVGITDYSELDTTTRVGGTAFSALERGMVTLALAADNWVQGSTEVRDTFNVYRAIADVVMAERGRFVYDREGKALFWNRLKLQNIIGSDVVLDDNMIDLRYVYAGLDDFTNEVIIVCHPRTLGATTNDVLWELEDAITVYPGQTRTIGVRYQDKDAGNARIGAKEVTLTDVTFSSGTATATLDARANSAVITVTNSGTVPAVLSGGKVRGRKITDYGRMEAQEQDGISIAKYGRRSLKLSLTSVDNLDYAQQIAQYELKLRSQPRGAVKEVELISHGTKGGSLHAQQLARTLGDVVEISESQTEHTNILYFIMGESHRLNDSATHFETTWYLEPAPRPLPWKLAENEATPWRSVLGSHSQEGTYLAF